ncbi:hypothetical protein GJAV_G00051990 [Gymnothorax javanicus]|nr:hypothetical protein GJAV_G00051990 [Gymnothorax javanicus]
MDGRRITHLAFLTLMLASTGFAEEKEKLTFKIEESGEKVIITCDVQTTQVEWYKDDYALENGTQNPIALDYKDDNTGEYKCTKTADKAEENKDIGKIYVKFRSCDNCVALDVGTVVGIAVGEVIATAMIGVAVYLLASQPQGKGFRQGNKASDRQALIQNQQNDLTYQPLIHGNSSEYSHLEPRRGRKH